MSHGTCIVCKCAFSTRSRFALEVGLGSCHLCARLYSVQKLGVKGFTSESQVLYTWTPSEVRCSENCNAFVAS